MGAEIEVTALPPLVFALKFLADCSALLLLDELLKNDFFPVLLEVDIVIAGDAFFVSLRKLF
jgi:hypothetical protein